MKAHAVEAGTASELTAGKGCGFATLLISALCVLAALAYFVLQMRLPAVGAVIVPNAAEAWYDDGVVVDALDGGLRDGDVVLAIDGRPLSRWAPLVAWGRSDARWQQAETVSVTVRRGPGPGGQTLTFEAPLRRYPLLAALTGTWSVLVFALVTFVVGAFVLWQRPELAAARVLFMWGASLLGAMTWALGLDVAQLMYSELYWLYTATACGAYLLFWTSGLHLSLIFPTAHPWIRGREQWLWLVHLTAAALTAALAAARLLGGGSLAWFSAFLRSVDLISAPTGVLMILILVWGYRRYYHEEARRRVRLFLYAAITCGGLGILVWNLAPMVVGRPLISTNAAGLLLIPAPVALALAIARHRLFDIDLIIRRTLIYSALTATLALVYFGSVVVLQWFLGAIGGAFSSLAVVLSTLAIATLFAPLRGWIQRGIDRRFYRRKYDAEATVARFAEMTQSEVDLDALSGELATLIERTVQPSFVSLWLLEEGRGKLGR